MRIAIDLTSLADNFSGIERHAAELSRALLGVDDKNQYTLVFKEAVHPFFEGVADEHANVEVVVLPRGSKGKLYFSQFTLTRELKKLHTDLVLFLAFPAPLLYTGRAISTFHDLCWHDVPETMLPKSRLYWKVLEKINARRNEKILTISQFSKSRIVEVLKVPADKVLVTYCGIDDKLFNRENAATVPFSTLIGKYSLPDKYVLTLSTIEPRKNIGLLIDAWAKACLEDGYEPDLVLAGRKGWKQEALVERVPQGLRNRAHFTGFVDDEDLPALYANSEVFVFPSIYEGFGLPPVEAAYSGSCVLCSDIPCLKEICRDGVEYFKSGNCEDLRRALLAERPAFEAASNTVNYSWVDSAMMLMHALKFGGGSKVAAR